MDVWQDIIFLPDRSNFAFSDPERLFLFLWLRAFEHRELLFDPYARMFDFFLEKLARPLYEKGILTRENLLTHGDDWLIDTLKRYYPDQGEIGGWLLEPTKLPWRKFRTEKAQKKFCAEMGDRLDHIDNISGFDTGLDLPVFNGKRIVPLRQVLPLEKVILLERIAASTKGYYVYYRK